MPGATFIEGDEVTLRTIEEEDLEFLQRVINKPEVRQGIGRPLPVNGPQEQEFFEEVVGNEETVTLLIMADGERVGTIGFNSINHSADRAEVGYWIAPDRHDKGYGSESTALLVDYGFQELGLHRIEARAFEFNDASQALLESVGFTEEGVHRDGIFLKGDYQDEHWYSVLESEWDGP